MTLVSNSAQLQMDLRCIPFTVSMLEAMRHERTWRTDVELVKALEQKLRKTTRYGLNLEQTFMEFSRGKGRILMHLETVNHARVTGVTTTSFEENKTDEQGFFD